MSRLALETKIFTGVTTQQTVVDFATEDYSRNAYLKSLVLHGVGASTAFTLALRQGKEDSIRTIAVFTVASGATTVLAGEDLVIDVRKHDALFITSSVSASIATVTLEDYDR